MSDPTDPTDPTLPASPVPPPRPRRRRWGRRIAIAVLLLVAVAAGLVALAPTLLSTRPAVNLALGQVNRRLNGRVEVADVSIGWTTGVRLGGLKVFDAAGTAILTADRIDCPVSLVHAATGSIRLGHTTVQGVTFAAARDASGRLNFADLAKPTPPPAGSAKAPPPSAGPSKVPDVSGDLAVTDVRGTFAQPGRPTVTVTSANATVAIPDLRGGQPIADGADAVVQVAGGAEGKIKLDGTAAVVRSGVVDLSAAKLFQTADVTGLDLAAVAPLLPPGVGITTLAGVVSAHVAIDAPDGKSATVDLTLSAQQPVRVGGPLLQGDTFATNTLTVAVPKLAIACPAGLGQWQTWHVTAPQPITAAVDQGHLSLAADAVPQAALNLLAGRRPASPATLDLTAHVDVAALAAQLPHLVHLQDGVSLTGGALDQTVAVHATAEQGTVTAHTSLTAMAGTRRGDDGRPVPVTIQPIELTAAATDVGRAKPLDGLRDLSLKVSSHFANGDIHGPNVGDVVGTIRIQLAALQQEAGQVVDFGGKQLGGELTFDVADTGQLLADPHQAKVSVTITGTDLRFADATGPLVAQPRVVVKLTGELHGSDASAVEGARDLVLAVQAGPESSPSVDLAVAVPAASLADRSATFRTTRLNVDVPTLLRQFRNVPAGQSGVVAGGGTLTGTLAGAYDPKAGLTIDPATALSLAHLTLQRQLPDGRRINAIADDTILVAVHGTVVPAGDTTTLRLRGLAVSDSAHIFDVHQVGDVLTVVKGKAMGGQGKLALTAELGSLADIVHGLSASAGEPAGGKVRSGHLTGTLELASANGRTDVTGQFDVPNLDVVTATGGPGPQPASVAVRASLDQPTNTLTADTLTVRSAMATATVTNTVVDLSAKAATDQLRRATLVLDVPDLRAVWALKQAFTPQPPPAKADEPPPLAVTGGSLTVRADVSHDGPALVADVPTVAFDRLAFNRGKVGYTFDKPVTAQLALAYAAGGAVRVTRLQAAVGPAATVTMTTPITIADLSHPAASADGAVKVDGDVAAVCQLLAALGGKPADAYPYRGTYTMTQAVTGDAKSLAVAGSIGVTNFQVVQGQTVQFAEPMLSVTDDVATSPDMNDVGVRTLVVDFKGTGALHLGVTNGSVHDLNGARQLHLPVALSYDLAKLWPIVHPMLVKPGQPDAYADVKVTGQFSRPALVAGRYPAGVPFTTAVKSLAVDCGIAVATLDHAGLAVRNLDVPVTVRDGKAVTVDSAGNAAPPAVANDGQLDLGHLTVDLTATPMRLTGPDNKVLLTHATINPLFADTFLNKYVNNPVFVGTKTATGLVDLTLLHCSRFPLGDLSPAAAYLDDGVLTIKLSLTDLNVGSQGLGATLGKVMQLINKDNGDPQQPDSFKAAVRDATVTLARGVATEDLTFQTGRYAIPFKGNVTLATKQLSNFTVGIPGSALARIATSDPNILGRVPAAVPVPVNGTLTAPQVDLPGAATNMIGKLVTDPNFLAGVLGGQLNKKGNAAPGNNGANQQPQDPLQGLGDLFKKKKKR